MISQNATWGQGATAWLNDSETTSVTSRSQKIRRRVGPFKENRLDRTLFLGVNETASVLGSWHRAVIVTTEHTIPISSDPVVNPIQQSGWQNTQQPCRFPRPRQFVDDKKRGATLFKPPHLPCWIVRDHPKRR